MVFVRLRCPESVGSVRGVMVCPGFIALALGIYIYVVCRSCNCFSEGLPYPVGSMANGAMGKVL